jgi:hypothetical protein
MIEKRIKWTSLSFVSLPGKHKRYSIIRIGPDHYWVVARIGRMHLVKDWKVTPPTKEEMQEMYRMMGFGNRK